MPWFKRPAEPTAAQVPASDPLVRFFIAEIQRNQGVDISKDGWAVQRLRAVASKTRANFASGAPKAIITLPFLTVVSNRPFHFETTVTPEMLDEIDRNAPLP